MFLKDGGYGLWLRWPVQLLLMLLALGILNMTVACNNKKKKKAAPAAETSEEGDDDEGDDDEDDDEGDDDEDDDDKKDLNSSAVPKEEKGFLTSSDFSKPTNKLDLDETKFKEALKKETGLRASEPTGINRELSDCILEKFDAKSAATSVTIKGSEKDFDCKANGRDVKVKDVKIEATYTCSKEAFEDLEVKKGSDLKEEELFKYCRDKKGTLKVFFNQKIEMTITESEKSVTVTRYAAISGSSSFNSPCEWKLGEDGDSSTTCIYATKDKVQASKVEDSYDSLRKITLSSVKGKSYSDDFYSSGSASFEVETWEGKVTFSSASSAKYEATDKSSSSNKKVEGELP